MKKLKHTLAAFPIFFVPMFWQTWTSGMAGNAQISIGQTMAAQTSLAMICAYCAAMLIGEVTKK